MDEIKLNNIQNEKEFTERLAENLAAQFGKNCEVAVHEFQGTDLVITHIENGYVTGRHEGDISTNEFLDEFFEKDFVRNPVYYMKTKTGKDILASTTYISRENKIVGFVCVNFDITDINNGIKALDWVNNKSAAKDVGDVNDVLEYHLDACVRVVGKKPEQMDRADKLHAVEYLESKHVFLITKSSARVCEYLNITKYGLYTFLDEIRSSKE